MCKEKRELSALITECDDIIRQINDKIKEYQNLLNDLQDTPVAEKLSEDYSVMLAEYRLYRENYSADRKKLQEHLKKVQDIIKKKENCIRRFHINPAEYENTEYSDDAYNHAEEQLEQAKR